MYELAKEYRDKNKAKAHRMATGDPHAKVDASSWTPPEPEHGEIQTGPRPISRRQFRAGGEVAQVRADRKPRKSGGSANAYVNRDVKAANEERPGIKHVGGMKNGGTAGDLVPTSRMAFQPSESRLGKAAGLRAGGKAEKCSGGGMNAGGRPKKAIGGDLEILSPALMALNANRGRKDKDEDGPRIGRKSGGRAKVAWAEGCAPAGRKTEDARIAERTDGRTPRKSGGKVGKTNINIIIGGPKDGAGAAPMAPPMPVPVPPRPPMPPMGAAPPPGVGGPPPAGPPPMMRKSGGRTYRSYKDMDAGALGGEGRLEKTEIQRRRG